MMPGLGQRRVDHPVLAEVLLQSLGHPEDSAQLADVLAGEHHLGVGLERPAEAGVECLGESEFGHRAPPGTTSNVAEVVRIPGLLLHQVRCLGRVHLLERVQKIRLRKGEARGSQVADHRARLGVHVGEEVVVGRPVPAQVGAYPFDRVLQPPVLQLVCQPVLGRIVGGGVRPIR